MVGKPRVLIGSPVRQIPHILHEFLTSLVELEQSSTEVDYLFIDDNLDIESSRLLRLFAKDNGRTNIIDRRTQVTEDYERDERTHYWKDSQVWKVAAMKDDIITRAREGNYDYLFLIDSDLVLHPATLEQLRQVDKDIVSCIYWTQWEPDTMEMPQVWLHDEYNQFNVERRQKLSKQEELRRVKQFYAKLRIPGIYEVGGLGACTLISRKSLLAGVCFAEIKNVSFWGEDRHFCIRAQAIGLALYVETTFPAYHIYRQTDLEGVSSYKQSWMDRSSLPFQVSRNVMSSEDWYRDASAMAQFGYEDATIEYFERFLETQEGDEDQQLQAYLHMAACYRFLGNQKQEKQILLQFVGQFRRAEVYCRLGMLNMEVENWNEAILWYEQAIQAPKPTDLSTSWDPSAWTWQPYLQLCVCYDRLGKYKQAIYYNEIGLSYEPSHPSMLLNQQYLMTK
ncbi:Tetratricopeptide repeat protein [compost metagenome]